MNVDTPGGRRVVDERARRTLFDAYWSSKGWRSPRVEPDPADLAHAKSAGVMFDVVAVTHDEAVRRIVAAHSLGDAQAVSDAFVASLASRDLRLRPALGSYHAVRALRPHAFRGSPVCSECRQFERWEHDVNIANFARMKWGALPASFALDHAFVLERFAVEWRPPPSAEDRALLDRLLSIADSLPATARARDLERAWKPVLASSREERDALIENLFACGVLEASRREPGDVRRIPLRSNWSDDAALWRGDDRVNRERASLLFGWA